MKLPAVNGARLRRRRIRVAGGTPYSTGIGPACACGGAAAENGANEGGEGSPDSDEEQMLWSGDDEEEGAGELDDMSDTSIEEEGSTGFSAAPYGDM